MSQNHSNDSVMMNNYNNNNDLISQTVINPGVMHQLIQSQAEKEQEIVEVKRIPYGLGIRTLRIVRGQFVDIEDDKNDEDMEDQEDEDEESENKQKKKNSDNNNNE